LPGGAGQGRRQARAGQGKGEQEGQRASSSHGGGPGALYLWLAAEEVRGANKNQTNKIRSSITRTQELRTIFLNPTPDPKDLLLLLERSM